MATGMGLHPASGADDGHAPDGSARFTDQDLIAGYVLRMAEQFAGADGSLALFCSQPKVRLQFQRYAVLPAWWFDRLPGAGPGVIVGPGWRRFDTVDLAVAAAVQAHPGLLPMPDDAVLIASARVGEEERSAMEGVCDAACKDCRAQLAACTRTVRIATTLPERLGRPIVFVCRDCLVRYRPAQYDPGPSLTLDCRTNTELRVTGK